MIRSHACKTFQWRYARITFWFLCLGFASSSRLHAHDPGLSAAEVRIDRAQLIATLTLARADAETLSTVDRDRDGKVTAAEFEAARPILQPMALHALEVKLDGKKVAAEKLSLHLDKSDAVQVELTYPRATGFLLSARSTLISQLPAGHRQYFIFRDARGEKLAERVMSAQADLLEIDLRRGSADSEESKPAKEFIVLGVEHILTGSDHLAFLFALLLAGGSLLASTKIITSFTAAHSITLALATLNLVNIPSSIAEPLIALSIVYVGLENILRPEPKHRWLLTFGFGMVHGFGFAAVLRGMGIGSHGEGLVVPLLSFNLGVELGQIAIAALALPVIWGLRRRPYFVTRLAPACSVFVAIMGAYWVIQRSLLP